MLINDYINSFDTIFTGDYKVLFEKEVDRLIELHFEVKDRKRAVEFLTDRYIEETGKRPLGSQLERLASHLLYESLEGDTRRDKMTIEEYPITTDQQIKRRRLSRGETPTDMQALNKVASDGKEYGKPTRRYRRPYENWHMEKQAHEKARATNAQYRQDTNNGSVVTV